MSWISAALPYVGGVLGSAVTYSLTWFRERRRCKQRGDGSPNAAHHPVLH
jgi:membrane protein YqaA with SNARE-associated domain